VVGGGVDRQWLIDMEDMEDIEGEPEGTSTSIPERLGLSEMYISSPLTLPAGVLIFIGSVPVGKG